LDPKSSHASADGASATDRPRFNKYHTHKNIAVQQWLAEHPRFHLHFTPTSASWLNQVEGWFSLLSQRAIRPGIFRSVSQLVESIQAFITAWNGNCRVRWKPRARRQAAEVLDLRAR